MNEGFDTEFLVDGCSLFVIITVYFGGLAVCLNINKIQSRECNRLM